MRTVRSRPGALAVMPRYEDPTKVDKLANLTKQVEETKGLMAENIKTMTNTHGELVVLVDKAGT
jgi:hypothetical protein